MTPKVGWAVLLLSIVVLVPGLTGGTSDLLGTLLNVARQMPVEELAEELGRLSKALRSG